MLEIDDTQGQVIFQVNMAAFQIVVTIFFHFLIQPPAIELVLFLFSINYRNSTDASLEGRF